MSLPRVAAIQMVSSNDIEKNLQLAADLIRQAVESGAELIVLPETFALFSAAGQYDLGKQGCDFPESCGFISRAVS